MAIEAEIVPVDVIVGGQRGDEAKGGEVDRVGGNYDVVGRFGGGPNAGHTVVTPEGEIFHLHGMPSGIVREHVKNVIGPGVYVDPLKLLAEIDYLAGKGVEVTPERLLISSAAHLILPPHIELDRKREAGGSRQGTTMSGIAFAASDKYLRVGHQAASIKNDEDGLFDTIVEQLAKNGSWLTRLRHRFNLGTFRHQAEIAERFVEQSQLLGDFITDTSIFLDNAINSGQRVLAEGAQGFSLDPDHGMYPDVTSSGTTAAYVPQGLGIAPHLVGNVTVVAKATPTHVGGGHFVTRVEDSVLAERLHGPSDASDAEFGVTTGRFRPIGHLDLPQLRRALMLNGDKNHLQVVLRKLDWVNRYGSEVPICTGYIRKGKRLPVAPDAAYKLRESEPVYETVQGWSEDISSASSFAELPPAARDYVHKIQDLLGVPIAAVGVGQRRDQAFEVE